MRNCVVFEADSSSYRIFQGGVGAVLKTYQRVTGRIICEIVDMKYQADKFNYLVLWRRLPSEYAEPLRYTNTHAHKNLHKNNENTPLYTKT